MVYGFLTVTVSGAGCGSGAWRSESARALACPFRRLRFSRSFAANLCSRKAACSDLVIARHGIVLKPWAVDRRFLALRRGWAYGKGATVAPGTKPCADIAVALSHRKWRPLFETAPNAAVAQW